MRGLLLLRVVVATAGMEDFNDWDLQAVVRSCSFPHQEEEEPAAGPPPARGAGVSVVPSSAETAGAPPARAPDQQMVVRAAAVVKAPGASALYDLEYLDLDHKAPFFLPGSSSSSPPRAARERASGDDDGNSHEVMISFPAVVASTSGAQPRLPPGRKPGIRSPRAKRSKKSQLKKVVCEVPVADGGVSSDLWAWRKYGQKPIKGSPYPRGYYKCSSMKGCMARKMVERNPSKPGMLIVTYMADHCHPVPTQLNALAGTTRHKSAPAEENDRQTTTTTTLSRCHEGRPAAAAGGSVKCEDHGNEAPAVAAEADDDGVELWLEEMELDEFLPPEDDDDGFDHVVLEEGALG